MGLGKNLVLLSATAAALAVVFQVVFQPTYRTLTEGGIVITGASSGIGEHAAATLSAIGCVPLARARMGAFIPNLLVRCRRDAAKSGAVASWRCVVCSAKDGVPASSTNAATCPPPPAPLSSLEWPSQSFSLSLSRALPPSLLPF